MGGGGGGGGVRLALVCFQVLGVVFFFFFFFCVKGLSRLVLKDLACMCVYISLQVPAMLPSGYMGSTLENDSYPTSEGEDEDEEEDEEEDLEEEEGSGVCVCVCVCVCVYMLLCGDCIVIDILSTQQYVQLYDVCIWNILRDFLSI